MKGSGRGFSAGLKRDARPDVMTPGWMPMNGVSKDIVPRILWRPGGNGWRRTASAASKPPIEWPRRMISVVSDVN